MKLVIDIPTVTYEEVKWRGLYLCPRDSDALVNSIKNGTQYEERPHGKWTTFTTIDGYTKYATCSCCGYERKVGIGCSLDENNLPKFCESCGSDNRKVSDKK